MKVKKIKWIDKKEYKPYYHGFVSDYYLFSIYKPDLSKKRYILNFQVLDKRFFRLGYWALQGEFNKHMSFKTLKQAKQKAEQLLNKLVKGLADEQETIN